MTRFLWSTNQLLIKNFKTLQVHGEFSLHEITEHSLVGKLQDFTVEIKADHIIVETLSKEYTVIHIERLNLFKLEEKLNG